MTLAEIMQKITELSAPERAILRRELEEMLSKAECEEVTPELCKELEAERRIGDERDLPIEDAIDPAKPEN